MASYTAEDIASAVAAGNAQMRELLKLGVAHGLPEHLEALDLLEAEGIELGEVEERAAATAELNEGAPLAGADRGAVESMIVRGRSGSLEAELEQLASEGEDGSRLAYEILELAAADGQEWAERLLQRETIAAEAEFNEDAAGHEFDRVRFDRAFNSAEQDGAPEESYARYVDGRLDPTPPKVEARPAQPGEATGGEGKRHVYRAGSAEGSYDQAFASFFSDQYNRKNGLEPEPPARTAEDTMTSANVSAIAADWKADSDRSAAVERHALEVQRKAAAT